MAGSVQAAFFPVILIGIIIENKQILELDL